MGKRIATAEQWAHETFHRCELGDARRTRRVVQVGAMLSGQVGSAPLRAAAGDEAASEGAYRLIRNKAVEAEALAEGGFAATVEAARSSATLLAAEDTTTLNYTHSVASELGDLGGPQASEGRGFQAHSVLLIDRDSNATVGLVEQTRWCRAPSERGRRHRRGERPYEEKESFKWQRASERMAERMGPLMERVISVCDREADVYEYLRYKVDRGERFVVRAAWDRRVAEQAGAGHLFEALESAPALGEHTVMLGQRGGAQGRPARKARLTLRASSLELRAPKRDGSLGSLQVHVVLAREESPSKGAQAASWLLLTSEPIETLEQVRQVVQDYARRWRVEEFHKAWKSGTKVEQRRMQSAENLERMVVMLSFVAVRLLQLREALLEGDVARAEQPCTAVLTRDEWRVLWLSGKRTRPPAKAPSLAWAYQAIAKLGGFIDTKRTGRAGWDTMWYGWFRFQERLDIYLMDRQFPDTP